VDESQGHGYQVDVDIVLWEGKDILQVPLTALFREGNNWAAFRVKEGIAESTIIRLGQRNTYAAEILSGLALGEQIILNPNDQVEDGVAVVSRDQYAD